MRILLLISVLLVTVSAFGQRAPVAATAPLAVKKGAPEPMPLANSVIRGRIVYDDNEMPVRRAKVMLFPVPIVAQYDTEGTERSPTPSKYYDFAAFTDLNGSFVLKNVPAGSFYPNIEHKGILGFSNMRGPYTVDPAQPNAAAEHYEILTTDGLGEIQIQIRAKRSSAIGGLVRYPDGEPAIGQNIELLRKTSFGFDSSGGGLKQETDERGAFRFAGLPPGEYIVRASERVAHGESAKVYQNTKSYLATYYPSKSSLADAELIVLGLGTDRSDIDINLPSRNLFTLRGSVLSKVSKEPVSVGKVSVRNKEKTSERRLYSESERASITLDQNGEWTFTDMPSGNYEVSFERGRDAVTSKIDPNAPLAPASRSISVKIEESDLNDIKIEVANESAITGTITVEGNKPVPYSIYANLYAEETKDSKFVSLVDSDRYDEDGTPRENRTITFRIGDLSAGTYTLDFSSNEDHYVKSATGGGVDLLKGKLTIQEAKTISGVRIVLSTDIAKVRGVAMDSKKAPLSGGFVVLIPVDMSNWEGGNVPESAYIDSTGAFTASVAPGDYFVVAYRPSSIPNKGDESTENTAYLTELLNKLKRGAQRITLKVGDNAKITVVETVLEK